MVIGSTRVALLVPLTGRARAIGQALKEAAELAVFDFAEDGFALVPFDTEAAGAAAAAQQAIAAGANLIVGPLFAQQVGEVGPVARAAGVPILSFSSDTAVAGSDVYVLGLPPTQAVARVIAHARSVGMDRFAGLVGDDLVGRRLGESLEPTVTAQGGRVVRLDTYPANTQDFQQVARRVSEFDRRRASASEANLPTDPRAREAARRAARMATSGPPSYQALVLSEAGDRLMLLAPWLPYYDVDPKDVKLIGTPLWDEPRFANEPGLVGAWFAAPAPDARVTFEERFTAVYARRPPRIATLAYDAIGLAAVIARMSGGPNFTTETLTNPSGFSGADGVFRLLPNGQVERGLAVFEVQKGGPRLISPAPTSFQTVTN